MHQVVLASSRKTPAKNVFPQCASFPSMTTTTTTMMMMVMMTMMVMMMMTVVVVGGVVMVAIMVGRDGVWFDAMCSVAGEEKNKQAKPAAKNGSFTRLKSGVFPSFLV